MLQLISVGVDDSTTADGALVWADHVAHATNADLRVVRAWEAPEPSLLLGALLPASESDEALEAKARTELESSVRSHVVHREAEQIVRRGHAGTVLVRESIRSDLVVLGRNGSGYRRLKQIILGSTARHVVNNARSAVAVVPEGVRWVDAPSVFVGIDGSASACEALRWAIEKLPRSAKIHAVWALDNWSDALVAADIGLFHHAKDLVLPELNRCIEQATDGNKVVDHRIVRRVEPGSPRQVFTDADLSMDLVVVAKCGRSGTSRPVLGSIADHLVRYTPCPIVVVPT